MEPILGIAIDLPEHIQFVLVGFQMVLLVLFGLAFAVAVVLWTEGTRRIPAAESGLLGCAETPFAALLADGLALDRLGHTVCSTNGKGRK